MRFKQIKIKNMFSYKGNVTFKFENSDKPVVLIIGENGFGKTSFINLVKIGLHGLTKDILNIGSTILSKQDFVLGNPLKNFSGILNKKAKREGENFCKIFIELEDDEILKIERSYIIHERSYVEKLAVYDEEDILIAEDEEAQDIINSKISPNMQKFFFFDGEKIQTIADFSQNEFKQLLEDVLDLKIFDQTVLDAQIVLKRINRAELENFSLEELNKKEDEYNKKQIDIEKEENRLAEEIEKLKEFEIEQKEINQKIKEIKNKYINQIEECKQKLYIEKENLKKQIEEFKNIVFFQLPLILNEKLYEKIKKDIETNYINRLSIDNKTLLQKKEQFLSKIEETSFKKKLEKIFDEVFKAKTDELSVSFADPVKVEMQFNNLKNVNFAKIITDISNTKDKIKFLEMEIFDLEQKVKINNKKLFDLQFKYLSELSEKIGSQKEKIKIIRENIEKLYKELKILEKEIGQYSIKEFNNSLAYKKRETLKAICNVTQFIKGKIKKEKRSKLEEAINKKFKLLKKDDYEADRICLDEDFNIDLIDKYGNPMDILSSSSGQKQIIATALIWGISEFLSQDIPMIIDTPLGRLDDKNQAILINKFYPNASNQVIILPTPSELKHPAFKNLKNSISQVFLLYNKGSSTTVKNIEIEKIYQKFAYQQEMEMLT